MFNNNTVESSNFNQEKLPDQFSNNDVLSSGQKIFTDAYDIPKVQLIFRDRLREMEDRLLLDLVFLAIVYRVFEFGQLKNLPWHNWDKTKVVPLKTSPLIEEARHSLGKPVWAWTKFASVCQSGYLGCAATVSDLLQHGGVNIAGSASVYGVVDQLTQLGWQRIKINDKHQFRSGDVVFGARGSHGHIGIISQVAGDKVFVCDNSSKTGKLKERTIESGGSFTPNGRFAGSLYVMRPMS